MNIIDKLERKFRWFGFPYLNLYMVIILLLGLLINILNPYFYLRYLSLNIDKVLNGEIYRLVTFIFYPISRGIFAPIMILVYYQITKTLVMMWGNFKFNLYLFIGYISQVFAAFIVYFLLKHDVIYFPVYTVFSLIMAFALSFPDAMFFVYFLIPIKAKYFAYMEGILYFISFLFSSLDERVAIVCSAINVFIFFVLLKDKIYE